MNYKITHTTTYRYSEPVAACHNEARLTPLNTVNQQCLASELVIDPLPSDYRERNDFFGNKVCYFSIQQIHKLLSVTAFSTVNTQPQQVLAADGGQMTWQTVAACLNDQRHDDMLEAQQYTLDSPFITVNHEVANFARSAFQKDRAVIDAVKELMERIFRDFTYDPHFSSIATPLLDVLKHRRGVCQDFAHLAIACLRSVGLAARYVSGYIETEPPEGQQRLVGADASHAWFSVYVPGLGWVDFDPTNNQLPMEKYITVAIGRDYYDVTPLKGVVFGGGDHELKVAVDVANFDNA